MNELIYISGKISGNPSYTKDFAAAALDLQIIAGCRAINPATASEGLPPNTYMHMAFAQIDAADAVALLPNWVNSKGAQLEKAYAEYIGKPVFEISELLTQEEAT